MSEGYNIEAGVVILWRVGKGKSLELTSCLALCFRTGPVLKSKIENNRRHPTLTSAMHVPVNIHLYIHAKPSVKRMSECVLV